MALPSRSHGARRVRHEQVVGWVGLMAYQVILRKLRKSVISRSLEDVLTASVIGAVAYGPPEMAEDWLRSCAGIEGASPDLKFEFWPRREHPDGGFREPDVFITGAASRFCLIVEAKQDHSPHAKQLIREGVVAKAHRPGFNIHLLTVSNQAVRPTAFAEIERLEPGLFTTMRHASWADMSRFLKGWESRPELDAGRRRLIEDALAVAWDLDREPFQGLKEQEVRAMEDDVHWMYALPRELVKFHRGLSRSVEDLEPSLRPIGNGVYTDGAVAYSVPERWLPRHLTLRYGETKDHSGEQYYFVRAVLNHPAIWVGYAPRKEDIGAMLDDPRAAEMLAGMADDGVQIVGIQRSPFEVLAGPVEPSAPAVREILGDPHIRRVNLVRIFPMSVIADPDADAKLEATLLRLVKLCRSVRTLGAP